MSIIYDGNPLKSYEKQKISVLDTHYNPFSNVRKSPKIQQPQRGGKNNLQNRYAVGYNS